MRVDTAAFEICLSDPHKPNVDLLLGPPEAPRIRAQCDRAQTIDQYCPPIQSHQLQHLVLWPEPDGNVKYTRLDVGEARFVHHVCEKERGIEVDAESGEPADHQVPVLGNRVVRGQASIMTLWTVVNFLKLEPATWL